MTGGPTAPNPLPAGDLRAPPAAPAELVAALVATGAAVDVTTRQRAEHARDWWPRSIPLSARGEVDQWPGVVVTVSSTEQVSAVLRVASAHRVAVTAQGGRSGVLGGAVPSSGAVALDLTGLRRVLGVDAASHTVRVEAGVFGPDLDESLAAHGLTVGHYPQSFAHSTVGGWIACSGSGQFSNRYGSIIDMVRALTVVLASGEVLTLGGRGPHEAVGPSLTSLFVGSEGTLGVITEATLVAHDRPASQGRRAYGFPTFDEGMAACRRVVQRGARPAVLRLYDTVESERHFQSSSCVLIVFDEGDGALVETTLAIVEEECARAGRLDDELVTRWLDRRNDVTALAPLWERGYVVDTMEVSAPWSLLTQLREAVTSALGELEEMSAVSLHQSHAYVDGACLYFTFVGRPSDGEFFYRRAWDVAMSEVTKLGGAISHHHGVGRARARFVDDSLGSGAGLLRAVKKLLDPDDLLNPGVLALGGVPW